MKSIVLDIVLRYLPTLETTQKKMIKISIHKLVSGWVGELRGLPHNGCDFTLQQLSAQFSVGMTPSVR